MDTGEAGWGRSGRRLGGNDHTVFDVEPPVIDHPAISINCHDAPGEDERPGYCGIDGLIHACPLRRSIPTPPASGIGEILRRDFDDDDGPLLCGELCGSRRLLGRGRKPARRPAVVVDRPLWRPRWKIALGNTDTIPVSE